MAARDLCTRADVTSYAPGYTSDATTDALLDRLITAESDTIHRRTAREFKAISPAVDPRKFDIDDANCRARTIRIGDVSAVTVVKLIDTDQTTTTQTVTTPNYVLLPRVREEWEPYTSIYFPPGSTAASTLTAGAVLEVTGTWGFPAVPDNIREACASFVLFRYVADVAAAGTRFAEALAEINVGALFAGAMAVVESYQEPLVA